MAETQQQTGLVTPWGLHPLPEWIVEELEYRARQYGQSPDPDVFSGTRTAWVRFFSNGKSKHPDASGKEGFAMHGTFGFSESFGFNDEKLITIGVDANGSPHKISSDTAIGFGYSREFISVPDFPNRPPPAVESLNCELNGGSSGFPNTCRKITVNWKCNSLAQLNYLMPYFLTPRITCLVEWGWSNYNDASLVDLKSIDLMNKLFEDPKESTKRIKKSDGNYDVGLGFITDYGYKMNDAGGYDCFTTITNANLFLQGEEIQSNSTTIKKGETEEAVLSFREFIKNDLKNIDIGKPDIEKKITALGLAENGNVPDIEKKIFRKEPITNKENGTKGDMWIRMDLVQDIINAFFKITMKGEKIATLRELDISKTIVSANPLLKSASENVLVPNKFAPRLWYPESEGVTAVGEFATMFPGMEKSGYKPDANEYNLLFREGLNRILKEYPGMDIESFDNLQEIINKDGDSFPIYKNETLTDDNGRTSGKLESGYWGYLKDLFIHVDYISSIVGKNQTALRVIEELLHGINDALCNICQLRLVPPERGNSIYSVIDDNISGINEPDEAKSLIRINLGSISSAYMKSAEFNVKISPEMMNQLVFQNANPDLFEDGDMTSTQVTAKPIVSRYAAGDRLYQKGKLEKSTTSLEMSTERRDAENQKKRQRRISSNREVFLLYVDENKKNYILCEKTKSFMNYILKLPNKKATYQNNAIMPGTTLTMEFLGISGIDYLCQFTIDHAPEMYNYRNAVWQVSDIRQEVSHNNWSTTIVAQVRPLTILTTR